MEEASRRRRTSSITRKTVCSRHSHTPRFIQISAAPPGSNSKAHSPGQRGPGGEGSAGGKQGSTSGQGTQGRGSGPVPPSGDWKSAPDPYSSGDNTKGSRRPGSSSSRHGGADPNNPYGSGETPGHAHGKAIHSPSGGPKEEGNGEGVDPIDPYEHDKEKKNSGKKGTAKGGSTTETLTEPSEHWHTLTHMHFGDPSSPDTLPATATVPTTGGPSDGPDGDTTHDPSSIPNGDLSTESVFPTEMHESPPEESLDSGEQSREEVTGGKGYRADKDSDFGVNNKFKGDESLSLVSSRENLGKSVPNDLSEVDQEVDKLQRLPVHLEQEELFKSTTGRTPGTFKPCCACCKEEIKVRRGFPQRTADFN